MVRALIPALCCLSSSSCLAAETLVAVNAMRQMHFSGLLKWYGIAKLSIPSC